MSDDMKSCAELGELVSAYADGELDANGLSRVESHLEECSECRERLEAYREMDAAASADIDAPAVSDSEWQDRRDELMANIATAPPAAKRKSRIVSIAWRVAATFALGAAAAIILAVILADGTGDGNGEGPGGDAPSEIISVDAGDDYSLSMDYFDDGVVVTFIAEAEE